MSLKCPVCGVDWEEWQKHGELLQKVQQLEEAITDLIKAVNASNFCDICSEELGTLACSECTWYQAMTRAIKLLVKEEAE